MKDTYDHANVPAVLRSLPDIIAEYEEKRDGAAQLCKDYAAFHDEVNMRSCISGAYVGRVFNYHPSLSERGIKQNLLESAWRHVYKGLQIDKIASAADRKAFDLSLKNPPEFTLDNIRATFGAYLQDPRFHLLKGLAECFTDLDQAYKSHSKVKIGVEGLPKRIILPSVVTEWGTGYGEDRLRDTLNALRVYEGKPHLEYNEMRDLLKEAKRGDAEFEGMTLRCYKNGNGHLIFGPEMRRMINLALAEFYGEVLPDMEPDEEEGDLFRQPSREVSKDLQYYWTPRKVIDRILRGLSKRENMTILEPQCGDGRIMDGLREWAPDARITGVEVHGGRAQEARDKRHHVLQANFLETTPRREWDLVVMNPPFSGTHWIKHLTHARKFLKIDTEKRWQDGTLVCILPATAFYDGHLGKLGLVREDAHVTDRGWRDSGWTDLPVASFAESGTNVPTGYLVIGARG